MLWLEILRFSLVEYCTAIQNSILSYTLSFFAHSDLLCALEASIDSSSPSPSSLAPPSTLLATSLHIHAAKSSFLRNPFVSFAFLRLYDTRLFLPFAHQLFLQTPPSHRNAYLGAARTVLLLSLGGGGEFGDVVNENKVGFQGGADGGGDNAGDDDDVIEGVDLEFEVGEGGGEGAVKEGGGGGFDGKSLLATMDLYFTSQNVIKSLKPMSSIRSYASIVWLNGEMYVFGGGNGYVWYDTAAIMSKVALNDKIFVVGGGNGVDCFSDVEMLDLDIRWWIPTCSMLDKRFSFVAVQLNGAIYATGRFDGNDYLRYALGGFDGFFLDLSSVILHTPCLYRDYNLTFLTLTATIWDRFKMSQD
ncbi:hypothetical protein JHK84_053037 [Glycine max]|nr:hypothetical protein JHK86_053008 [Glycine max]KAG5082999.1 hypothetical protein JHK84_053037 [Glycine max]